MPLILSQKLGALEYDDIVGEQYHYPRKYLSYVVRGEMFVYYHPAEQSDRHRYYFGIGRIGNVTPDPGSVDHLYAEILDYTPFKNRVPYKKDGVYLEARPEVGTQFFRAVRKISEGIFDNVAQLGEIEPDDLSDLRAVSPTDEVDAIINRLNEQYKSLEPRVYKKLVAQIDRPSAISRALKQRLGYRCQVCQAEGFPKKSGGAYVEAHHLLSLHKLIPGSLVSENVLIVCANCRAKLHYADVELRIVPPAQLEVIISGIPHLVRRNLL